MKKQIEDWLLELSHNEVIPENIVALNFGIFESENGYCVYLIGSESYDVDDDDWACDVDYEPVDKYLNIEGVDVDPDKFLNEVITILLDIISLEKVSAWLLHTKHITVGLMMECWRKLDRCDLWLIL